MDTRDSYLDNLKLILVLCVVCTHFLFEYRDTPIMISLFNGMCSFIMPVFIFISGYLSKNIRTHRSKDIMSLLLPYFILELLNLVYSKVTHMGYGNKSLLTPTYQNWYLLSLFFWRLIVPYFRTMKSVYAIIIGFIISISAGFVSQFGEFLALYRTFFYLPVFLLGYYARDIYKITERPQWQRYVAFIMFLGFTSALGFISYSDPYKADDIFYAYLPNFGYTGDWHSVILRNIALFSSIICGYCFLYLIPKKRVFFTKMGVNTLYVYLFHMFLVFPIIKLTGIYKPVVTELVIVLSAIGITMLLSYRPVAMVLKAITYPSVSRKIKDKIKA
ncbi:MAG: acyltransferase family protein [Chitinophagaceae bacterium]